LPATECAFFSFKEIRLRRHAEIQIETTDHLNKPLMYQMVRDENENALDALQADQAVQNHACFNGFAQANFIRKQYSWQSVLSNLRSDMKLMRK